MKRPWRERPVFPDRRTLHRKFSDERGVSPVIAVILMVAITVVLAAVLYTMVILLIQQPEITPPGSLIFNEDPNETGKYFGTFQGSIKNSKLEIRVLDTSEDKSIILKPDEETEKQIEDGLNITYYDNNNNDKMDASDIITIKGGDIGDTVTVVYEPTGKVVAITTLT